IGHREHSEPESERNAQEANAQGRIAGGQHRSAATAEGQPECAEEFSRGPPCHVHVFPHFAAHLLEIRSSYSGEPEAEDAVGPEAAGLSRHWYCNSAMIMRAAGRSV